jgi:hypothetical protein
VDRLATAATLRAKAKSWTKDTIQATMLRRSPAPGTAMSDPASTNVRLDVFALALAAGLEKAVRDFPDDVRSAAQAAAQDRDDMPAVGNTERPWPPMRMRSGR